jgi:hypothetical protein
MKDIRHEQNRTKNKRAEGMEKWKNDTKRIPQN